MKSKQNYRGPSSIESTTTDLDIKEASTAIANGAKGDYLSTSKGNVLGKSEPAVQRKLAEEKEEQVQRKESANGSATISSGFQSGIDSSKGGGKSMDTQTSGFMASRFGTDFNGVKIHNNSRAHKMASEINARAFTVGKDVYFNEGEYRPQSQEGKYLLAHELAHVVQQNNGVYTKKIQRKCDPKAAKRFYTKSKMGKKIQWTAGLVDELYKVVGKGNKALYESAKLSGKLDGSFFALVCKAQEILGFKGDDVDGKIGTKTISAWNVWKTGGKKGIDYGRLFKDKKLEIGVAVGYDKSGMTKSSSALILAVLNDKKYGLKKTSSTTTSDRYEGKRKYRVQGDNTAPPIEIHIIIDVIDATKSNPKATFSKFITKKEMTLYVGHARYGTGPDFDPKKSAAQNFIIGVNSALHKAGKLKKGYDAKMNAYLKGKANDLEKLSKAGKFNKKTYQVWFLNACSTIHYLDEIRGGLVADAKGAKKTKDDLRIMGTNKPVGIGSAGVILKGILEMQTMEQIMEVANKKQGGGKQRYFAD